MPSWVAKGMQHFRPSLSLLLLVGLTTGAALAQDSDHDGVLDHRDRCPNTRQLQKLPADFKYGAAINPERLTATPAAHPVDANGCEPDSDGDGIVNSLDYCPHDAPESLAMGVAANGCPKQSDADGTPDYRDHCPGTPPGVKTDRYGCGTG